VENICHGKNGFLYAPGDRQDFNRQLKKLIENESLRQTMGDRAYVSIQQYSWEQAIQNLVDIWQETIENNYCLTDINQLSKVKS
jgi:glycosyltransferase involved in cell wall biosynthesis